MAEGVILSREAFEKLKKRLEQIEDALVTGQAKYPYEIERDSTIGFLIARTPPDGIPALTEATGASIADTTGSADCNIYRVIEGVITPALGIRKVHNLSHTAIGGARWVHVAQDNYGTWYALTAVEDQEISDTGTGTGLGPTETGTGTGTGTAGGCDPVIIRETDIRCEFSSGSQFNLNVYKRLVTIDSDNLTGCLTKTTGEWELEKTIGCCDNNCADDTGTAPVVSDTGTGTTGGTVEVDCCAPPLPETLYATISDQTGDCTCIPAETISLTFNGTDGWTGAQSHETCIGVLKSITWTLTCGGTSPNDFSLLGGDDCGPFGYANAGASCSPLMLVFDLTFTDCCNGTIRVTITE